MARYIEIDEKKVKRLMREAQQFQDDITCAVGTDFMQKIAIAENKMIFDIIKGLATEPTEDVVPRSEVEEIVKFKDMAYSELKSYFVEAKQEVARSMIDEISRYISLNENIAKKCKEENGEQNREYFKGKLSAFLQVQGFIDVELKRQYKVVKNEA